MIYVEDFFIEFMPERKSIKTPRERYIVYQKDLHQACGENITLDTMWEGDQYSYVELGDSVLKKPYSQLKLKNIDLTIFACWTPEFDPDYSAFGPYFMHTYELGGSSFDICDCGSLPDFISLDVVQKFCMGDKVKKALLLGLEQNTIPRNINLHTPIPNNSRSVALIVTSKLSENSKWAVLGSGYIKEKSAFDINPLNFIIELQSSFNVEINYIASQITDIFYKKLVYQLDTEKVTNSIDFIYWKQNISGLHAYSFLAEEYESVPKDRNILFVYNDIESLNIGWLLLYKI